MRKSIFRLLIVLTANLLFINLVFAQGLYWESTVNIPGSGGKEVKSSSAYMPKMFKQMSENNGMIFRLDKDIMYLVDNQKKEYAEMTFAEMETATKRAMDQLEELKKKLKDMPPEQRQAMEKMLANSNMAGDKKSKIDVKKSGEKKNISGYSCIKYVLKQNGKEVGTIWTTSGVPDYAKMKKDLKAFSERLMAQMPNGKELSSAMNRVEGFPVQTDISGMTTTVTKVEKKSIPIGDFEPPSGFRKVDKSEMMGQ